MGVCSQKDVLQLWQISHLQMERLADFYIHKDYEESSAITTGIINYVSGKRDVLLNIQ